MEWRAYYFLLPKPMPTVTDKLAKIKHLTLTLALKKINKEGLGAPHERVNPKKLRIWTNQK
jgi:hypothetical protein